MGHAAFQCYRLDSDDFLQAQLIYCSKQIVPLIQQVNNTFANDISKTYIFGSWDKVYEMSGIGIIYLPRKYYYDGGIRKGKPHGTGRIIWINQNSYYGDVNQGKATGFGKFYSPSKDIKFEGNWLNGYPNNGKLSHQKSYFLINFQKHREATIKLQDGIIYTGSLAKKINVYIIDGYGKMTFPDGSYYQGNFREGHMHGRGSFVWKSGQKYKGDYYLGKRQGYGVYFYNQVRVYKGNWEDGKQHGEGCIYQNNILIIGGRWEHGIFQLNNQ